MTTIEINVQDVVKSNIRQSLRAQFTDLSKTEIIIMILETARGQICRVPEGQNFQIVLVGKTKKTLEFKRMPNDTEYGEDENGFRDRGMYSVIIESVNPKGIRWTAPQYQCGSSSSSNLFASTTEAFSGLKNAASGLINGVSETLKSAKDSFDFEKQIFK